MRRKIRAVIMDVDGTMTDGKIYMGIHGEEFKAFNTKDGYGIREILPNYNIRTVIMTGRASDIVLKRSEELEIDYVFQNIKDKGTQLQDLAKQLQCDLSEFAYIGDDIADKDAMQLCGIRACPADAVSEVKAICDYISSKNGGDGAVRDFIEWLVNERYDCN